TQYRQRDQGILRLGGQSADALLDDRGEERLRRLAEGRTRGRHPQHLLDEERVATGGGEQPGAIDAAIADEFTDLADRQGREGELVVKDVGYAIGGTGGRDDE